MQRKIAKEVLDKALYFYRQYLPENVESPTQVLNVNELEKICKRILNNIGVIYCKL